MVLKEFCKSLKVIRNLGIILVCSFGCRHYHIIPPIKKASHTLVLAPIENRTNEARLAYYTKQNLSELITTSGFMPVGGKEGADATLYPRILSYEVDSIGETQIDSNDDNQRKFRSTVFRVKVDMDYSLEWTGAERGSTPFKQIRGVAEFNELVDLDIVRKDGLKRAIYKACEQLVTEISADL